MSQASTRRVLEKIWLPSVRFDGEGTDIDLKLPAKGDYKIIIEGISDEGPIFEKK